MNQFSYRPGAWQLVAETGGVIAVPGDVDAQRLETLHRMLRDGAPELTDVIDVLAGGSIATLGSFAVALTSQGSIRFAVRGAVQARILGGSGDEIVSGAEVSTWTERFIADPKGFELTIEDPSTEIWYPIVSGVVLAAAVRHGQTVAAATPTQAAPAAEYESAAIAEKPAAEAPVEQDAQAFVGQRAEPAGSEPAESDGAGSEPAEAPDAPVVPEPVVDLAPHADEPPISQTLIPADLTFVPEPASAAQAGAEATGESAFEILGLDDLGDHDGATISVAELRRLRSESGITTEPPTAGPDAPTAVLPAVSEPERPHSHGIARLSTGQVVELDRTVIIGRRPRSTRTSGDNMPHLVAVESPQQDISRSHLEIRPEGDSVVVIDLRTTNGSTLLRPGADPVRLHPGEHTLVLSGDVVDLGDDVTVAFEGLT